MKQVAAGLELYVTKMHVSTGNCCECKRDLVCSTILLNGRSSHCFGPVARLLPLLLPTLPVPLLSCCSVALAGAASLAVQNRKGEAVGANCNMSVTVP
jgi:hypothetical protein